MSQTRKRGWMRALFALVLTLALAAGVGAQPAKAGPGAEVADRDQDGLPDAFELRFWGGLAAEPHDDADGDGATNLEEFVADTNPLRPPPTCSFPEEDFVGGLNGYCTDYGDGTYDLLFEDFDGVLVLSFDWPGNLSDPRPTDCLELCMAGAMQVAYTTDRLNIGRPYKAFTSDPLAAPVGCPLSPNANEAYDNCTGGGSFRCFLACGKGCVGCEVTVGGDCGTEEQPCKYHQFKCYKRPCCVTHDKCLDKAKDIWEELRCHREAQDNGCDYEDAKGKTHGKADATCFNPARQCIKVPKQACCIGVECADMMVEDCEAMGGVAQGEHTGCRNEIPYEDGFEPVPIPEEAVEVPIPVTCKPGR